MGNGRRARSSPALKKLAFDLAELYARRSKETGYAFSHDNPWQREFEDLFPYELTEDQQKSVAQIEADMESPRNMDRLLCGDVGYGKTEVGPCARPSSPWWRASRWPFWPRPPFWCSSIQTPSKSASRAFREV